MLFQETHANKQEKLKLREGQEVDLTHTSEAIKWMFLHQAYAK